MLLLIFLSEFLYQILPEVRKKIGRLLFGAQDGYR